MWRAILRREAPAEPNIEHHIAYSDYGEMRASDMWSPILVGYIGGTLQHLAASLYIKSYDYGNIVLCCEIL